MTASKAAELMRRARALGEAGVKGTLVGRDYIYGKIPGDPF